MNHRFLLFGLPVLLAAQGITVNDPSRNWASTVPEPPIPRVSAGQSFLSFYGHKVTRITDPRSSPDGGSWMHFYSDRSPLSRNSTYLVYHGPGGSTWVQPLNGSSFRGSAWSVYSDHERPQSIGQSIWSPGDDEVLYFIGDRVQLWMINARTRKKKMIRDFTKEIAKGSYKEGYLRLQFASKDGKRLSMDYMREGKAAFGILLYDVETNTARMHLGDRLRQKSPVPINSSFRLAGSGAEKDGAYLFVQENGNAINGSSGNPQEAANTYTYVVPWNEDALGSGKSLSGVFATNHGAALSKSNVRISGNESGYYINNVDWLYSMRRADLTKEPTAADKWRFPYRDIFHWPYSTGTGAHVSSGGISDDWLALSLYQESSCGQRIGTPLSNEIIMLSANGEAIYDEKTHRIVKNGDIHRLTHHYSYPEDCEKPEIGRAHV